MRVGGTMEAMSLVPIHMWRFQEDSLLSPEAGPWHQVIDKLDAGFAWKNLCTA